MRPMVLVGVLLIAFGLVGLVAGGLTYTKKEETADIGPIDVTVKEKKRVVIPTGVAVAAVVAGVAVLLVGSSRRGGST